MHRPGETDKIQVHGGFCACLWPLRLRRVRAILKTVLSVPHTHFMFSSRSLRKAACLPFQFPWHALPLLLPAVVFPTLALYAGFLFHALGL
jgi:hypothetical protein